MKHTRIIGLLSAAEPDVLATEPQDAPESLLSDTDDTLTILSWNPCDIWPMAETYILPSIAKHNYVVLCRLRSSRQSHYVALAEGV